ncbi:alpha/beta fold hydrolase [Streptomyces sp. CA-106110]|uniref:alpha/beta fold hydrolase n=1 Tax=Streptomyces sp. CA-106110 TaxID=3240044 RepID=UPI003D8CE420
MSMEVADTETLLKQISELQVDEGFASNGDVQIHYRTYGAGPAIVFQHGFPDNELSYMHQVVEFAKDHLVITPTLRGYPPSTVLDDPERYTIPELSTDIRTVLDHLGVERAVVAGHDWGGVIIQAFALLNPERVESLILLNTPILQPFLNLVNSDPEQQRLSEYTIPYIEYENGDDKNIEYVVRFIRNPEWRERISAYLQDSPINGMLSYYKMGYPAPPYGGTVPDDVSGFVYRVPTLIVWGLEDPYFSLKHLNDLWDWFTESYRFVSVPGAGHWLHQDAPQKVNQEIRSWLAAQERSQ